MKKINKGQLTSDGWMAKEEPKKKGSKMKKEMSKESKKENC